MLRTLSPIAFGPFAEMFFVLRLDPPVECPRITWIWGDGERSVREADCHEGDVAPMVHEMWHRYRVAGDFDVTVVVEEGGREIAAPKVAIVILAAVGPGR